MRVLYRLEDRTHFSWDFKAPDPPLKPGDVLSFRVGAVTLNNDHYEAGDKLVLIERTDEAPYKRISTLGNWRVLARRDGKVSVWSNIEWMLAEGNLLRD